MLDPCFHPGSYSVSFGVKERFCLQIDSLQRLYLASLRTLKWVTSRIITVDLSMRLIMWTWACEGRSHQSPLMLGSHRILFSPIYLQPLGKGCFATEEPRGKKNVQSSQHFGKAKDGVIQLPWGHLIVKWSKRLRWDSKCSLPLWVALWSGTKPGLKRKAQLPSSKPSCLSFLLR